ncbi:MAG: ABC transporter permease, partial [Chloroflexota bacterium]|nr:ABC transporter permease [Chloroflexota bacterium]
MKTPLRKKPLGSRLSRAVLPVYTALAVLYLFIPIVVMVAFSFNDPRGRQNITWQGFTAQNYVDVWSRPDVTGPMITSLIVAVVATLGATVLGTLIGLALTRYQFRGRGPTNLLIYVP